MSELIPSEMQGAAPPENVGFVDKLKNRWLTTAVLGLVGTGVAVIGPGNQEAAHAVDPIKATIGMPFQGKWAWNVAINPPYTDSNSSHPSVHERYGADWTTDIYAAVNTPVKVYGTSNQGIVTFKKSSTSDTCSSKGPNIAGQGLTFDVLVNGAKRGTVKYDHIDPETIGTDPITSGTKIGEVTSETLHNTCFQTRHVHVQFKNVDTNKFACYTDHGKPGQNNIAEGQAIGDIGSQNTGVQQACTTGPIPPTETTVNPVITSLLTPDNGGTRHVFTGTDSGKIYETYWNANTSPTTVPLINMGEDIDGISVQVTPNGDRHLYYGTQNGRVGEVYWGPSTGGNITAGQSTNAIGSPVTALSSELTPDGDQHIISAHANGRLYETYWGNGPIQSPQAYNLGKTVTGLSTQMTGGYDRHIFYGAADGEVGEIYYGPNTGGAHKGMTGNVGTNVTDAAGRITADGTRHVYSVDSAGDIEELWWTANSASPTKNWLTNVGQHPTAVSSQVTPDGRQHVYYGTSFDQSGEVYWGGAGDNGPTLTRVYTDPANKSVSDVSSLITPDGAQNLFIAHGDGSLVARWWNGNASGATPLGTVS